MNLRFEVLRQAPIGLALFASLVSPACGAPDDDDGTAMTAVTTDPTTPAPTATTPTPGPTPPPVTPPPPGPTEVAPVVTTPPEPAMPPEPVVPPEPVAPPEPVVDPNTPPERCTTAGPAFATIADIMDAKCTASCHEPGGLLGGPGGVDPRAMLDLKPAGGYAQLTTAKSLQVDMWLVGTGLGDSYLWHKLQDTQATVPGGEGTVRMPLTGEMTAEELAAIEAWILGSACP